MTANRAIAKIAEIKPHAYSDDLIHAWVAELDGKIALEVLKTHAPKEYQFPRDGNLELLAPAPYDNIYELYICAMIDFCNREYANYQNSMAMFNSAYSEFATYYLRAHMPEPTKQFKNIM